MPAAELTDEQRVDWLRLIRSENVGPRTFRALINQYGGAAGALEALPDLARKGGRLMLRVCSRDEALREIDGARRLGARFVAMGEPDYPKPLQATDTAPPLICVRGDVSALSRPCVAIVGSRNASAAGLTFAGRLARELGEAGFVVVSGLARGVDAAAHKSAPPGATVAVLAGGQDQVYPAQNEPLLARIIEGGGAAVSEMPLGWEPRARDFPRRNRIVSGLSLGVIVIEAARRSGSLITARFAAEQGREVFAVPGSPLDPRAEGTNDLIRQGATLCASAEHVASSLAPLIETDWAAKSEAREDSGDDLVETLWDELDFLDFDGAVAPAPTAPLRIADERDGDENREREHAVRDKRDILLELLGPSPVSIDDLSRQSGLPVRAVNSFILELEIGGRLERHGGNAVSLIER
ncbi:MAG: DNA-protecting protein DprA [Salinarimonadaceae bacterium]|nr:MAG: DNA-protecting protein DprA [Salinarimonadaceae bacterium]